MPLFATILAALLVLAVLVVPTLSSHSLGSFVTSSGTLNSQTLGSLVLVAVLLSTLSAISPEVRETHQVMSLSEIAPGGPSIGDASAVGSTISTIKCPLVLKTSDQYDLWARVGDTCWASTMHDIWILTDDECKRALGELTPDQKTPHVYAWGQMLEHYHLLPAR